MNLPAPDLIIVSLAFFGNVMVGLFTYLKNPKSASNRFFMLFTMALGTYLFLNYSATHQKSDFMTLLFIRTVMGIGLIINLLFLLLADAFPYTRLHLSRKVLILATLVTLGFLPFTQTRFVFSSLKPGTVEPIPGPGMAIFLLHTVVSLGLGVYYLAKKFRNSKGIIKAQLRLLLLGALLMFTAILITNVLLVVVFRNSALVGLLPIYTLIFVSFISYAIVRHRFLDVSLLIIRAITYFVITVFVGILYSLIFFIFGRFAFNINLSNLHLTIIIGITVLLSISFQKIQRSIGKVTNKILFKSHYDSDEVLQELSHIMATTIDLKALSYNLLEVLLKKVNISAGAFILVENERVSEVVGENFTPEIKILDDQFDELVTSSALTILEDLDEGKVKDVFRELNLSISVQLYSESKLIGLLVLGQKASGDIYTQQDISLLKIFADEAAIAIQNSQSYEQIRRFNITLQEEVNRATASLKIANEHLKELDKLKDEFISIASHELRSPAAVVKDYLWTIMDEDKDMAPEVRSDLEKAMAANQRLVQLVNELLDVSRIEGGKLEISKTIFDLEKLLSEVCDESQNKAKQKNIKIDCQLVSARVEADMDKIRQVINNLVDNAIKYSPVNTKVDIRLKIQDSRVRIEVTDQGIGIDPAQKERMFTKFGRLNTHDTVLGKVNGTGLGLYICKKIVELSGGNMGFDSEYGKGTTFWVELPALN